MRKHLLMALLCLAAACGIASSALAEKVSYIEHGRDEEAHQLTTTTQSVECTMLTGDETSLAGGWYAAKGTLTYSNLSYCNGNVNPILTDGCKVKVDKALE